MGKHSMRGVSVLHVITRLDKGGSAEVVLDLARLLREDGARVAIISGKTVDSQEDETAYAERTGVEMFRVSALVREISGWKDFQAYRSIRDIVRAWRPDIVHTHTSKAGILGRWAARAAGARHRVHTPHGHIFYGYFNPLATTAFISLEKVTARITDRIVTLSRPGMEDHLRAGVGRPGQFRIIPSGTDIRRFICGDGGGIRAETGWSGEKVAGWAGRLTAIKDCGTFLRAAGLIGAMYPDARFLVAGDGEERNALEQLAGESGLDGKVRFLGNRGDMPSVMAAMDVFVLSSRNEGFGRVLVEAMAAGVPVVATDVGGVAEVVEDGVSGLLVPPGDPECLAEAMRRLFEDEFLRNRLRENGRMRAWAYDTRQMVDSYEDMYAELLNP